jgi:hypothetical protein
MTNLKQSSTLLLQTFCLLGLFLLVNTTQSLAQTKGGGLVNEKKVIKKKRDSHYNDLDRADYTGKDKPVSKKYQGTGKSLTAKVRTKDAHLSENVARDHADYSGNVKYVDREKVNRKASGKIANYSGNIRYVDIAKRRASKDRKLSAYSGNISTHKLKIRNRDNRDKDREIADFSGNIRYVDIGKKRERMSAKMSAFKGAVPIRIRKKPKGSLVSSFRGETRRAAPANYNRKSFKSGRKVKKSDLPNYLKTKPGKVRYDSRETKMWLEGGKTLPKRTDRDAERKKLVKSSKAEKSNKGKKGKKQETPTENTEQPENKF